MVKKNIDSKVTDLQNRIVNFALVGFSCVISITFIIVTLRAIEYGFVVTYFIQAADWFILFMLALYRKKTSLYFKIVVLLSVMLVIVITGLYSYGYLAAAKIFIVIIPVFASFVLSYKRAILVLLVYMSVYVIFAYLHAVQLLSYDIDVVVYVRNYVSWAIDAGTIFFTSVGLLYVSYFYKKQLLSNYLHIENQNIELINKEKKYRTLFECSNDAIILIDNQYFFDCNSITYQMFKCSDGYFDGKAMHEFSPELQPDGSRSLQRSLYILKNVSLGRSYVYDWQLLRPNGEVFDVSVSASLVELENKKYFLIVLRDITFKKQTEFELAQYRMNLENLVQDRTNELNDSNEELKAINEELYEKSRIINETNIELNTALKHLRETQMQLLQADKMASLGILTSGVAHEINNPLNFIKGGFEGIEDYFKTHEHERKEDIGILLNSINTGVYRAETIVNSLNQFSRDNDILSEECDVHAVIENCLVMLQHKTKYRIVVEKKLVPEMCTLKGNVGKLHQVFINVLTNAIQAIENEGVIRIETLLLNNKITVNISDSGCGISHKDLSKIMDPFYTTKDPGQGTGLGLSISYAIIHEHKGDIKFQSELNKGTSVIITLPISSVH